MVYTNIVTAEERLPASSVDSDPNEVLIVFWKNSPYLSDLSS